MTWGLVLGALLAAAAVVVVAWPFLREPGLDAERDRLANPDATGRRRPELAEGRDRVLGAPKELEVDHRPGKGADEGYRPPVGPLRRRAAETLPALDRRDGAKHASRPERERSTRG